MKYKSEVVRIRENSITLNGWVLGKNPESRATFRVEDEKHRAVKFKMVPTRRDDVSQIYFTKVYDKAFGFDIRFHYDRGKSYWLLDVYKRQVFVSMDQNFEPKSAAKRLPDGTLVSPPLEDLSPFLPEEEMDANMIIPRIRG